MTDAELGTQKSYEQKQEYQRPPYPTAAELIKQAGTHPLYLPATILYTIYIGLTTIQSSPSPLHIPILIALWMFYAECKKDRGPFELNTASFKILKVVKIIEAVILCIGALGSLLLAVVIFLLATVLSSSGLGAIGAILGRAATLFTIAYLAFSAISLIFGLVVKIGMKNILNSAIASAKSGLRPSKTGKGIPVLIMLSSSMTILVSVLKIFAASNMELLYENFAGKNFFVDLFFSIFSISIYTNGTEYYIINAVLALISALSFFMYAKILLDSFRLTEASYYPSPEEAYYNICSYCKYKHEIAIAKQYEAYKLRQMEHEQRMQRQLYMQQQLLYYRQQTEYLRQAEYQRRMAMYQYRQYPQYPQYPYPPQYNGYIGYNGQIPPRYPSI